MKRIAIGSVFLALVAAAPPAAHAGAGQRPRPTDLPPGQTVSLLVPNELQIYNDYATEAVTYSSRRAAVHFVTTGVDAPPLNDDDANGVPDYVERVGDAADAAIDYYQSRGFAAILPDEGADSRPDVYVSRFAPGYFGVAFPAVEARGGAFVVVSNALDPSPERSLGSLYGTVAHELFHLVQFSYFPPTAEPEIPEWVLEGSAMAMERGVYAQLDDLVSSLQLRRWFDRPEAGLTTQSYGSQLLWRYLDERRPRLLPRYLRWLAHRRPARASAAAGLAATYARVTGRPFAAAFGHFAAWTAGEYAARIRATRTLAVGVRATGRVAPLAIHFLRLPHQARAVRFRVARGRPGVALVYEHESPYAGRASVTRRLPGREVHGALVFTIPASLQRNPRFGPATLVVANGDPSRAGAYSVSVARNVRTQPTKGAGA